MSVSQGFDTSASSCESEVTLDAWTERHHVSFNKTRWSDEQFHGFIDAQVYPNFLRSEAIIQTLETRLLKTDYGRVGLCFFNGWRNYDLMDKQFEDDDRYELQTWLMHLACSWMSSLSKRKMKEPSHVCKNGVESIIELAFQLRAGADQVWLRDAELVLPDEPDAVIADSIAFMRLPGIWRHRFENVKPSYPFSWSYSNKPESIITFVFIASENDSDYESTLERLRMCFYSVQMHRRALCCEDAPVFGMTLHNGLMEFYVSFWEERMLAVRPIFRRYVLEFYSDFAECYFVLCRIAEYTSEFLQKQLAQWKNEIGNFKEKVQQVSKCPWRSKTREGLVSTISGTDQYSSPGTVEAERITVTMLKQIRDRKTRILLESICRGPYSAETGYQLTRKNKWAFDILTKAHKTERTHCLDAPAVWAEETDRCKSQYEDPGQHLDGDVKEEGELDWENSEARNDVTKKN